MNEERTIERVIDNFVGFLVSENCGGRNECNPKNPTADIACAEQGYVAWLTDEAERFKDIMIKGRTYAPRDSENLPHRNDAMENNEVPWESLKNGGAIPPIRNKKTECDNDELVKRIIERAEKNMVPSEVKDVQRILASIKLQKRYSDVTEEELQDFLLHYI
jgi:hypothetical protein